ncbi:MAG TPA: glycosyltransferase family 9 protein [Thermoanaerobaculia bacterium]|nr:glycosyltransferase family 9 protein [Thermoanaerobaculia bacterium]
MRILIVRLSSLGDIIHALPLALNARMGGATVAWLTERGYGGLLEGNPSVEKLFLADTRRWRGNLASITHWKAVVELRRELKEFAPDATLDPQGLWKSALLARLAGAPVIGFSAGSRREPSSAMLARMGVDIAAEAEHVVDQNLTLLTAMSLPVTRRAPDARYLLDREDPKAAAFLRTLPTPFVLYHPGSARMAKSWGERNYADLAARLRKELGAYTAISWGPGDERRAARLSKLLPYSATMPALGFRGLAQVMARAMLFVAGDTGPVHLADAVGAPALAIFGPDAYRRNVPERNRPYRGAALSYDQAGSVDAVARKAVELVKNAGMIEV